MPGWTTNGVFGLPVLTGSEQYSVDTEAASGQQPQTGQINLIQSALMASYLTNTPAAGKTMVAGTRYYTGFVIGQPRLLTGLSVLVGGTGGTDNWYVELHDATGTFLIQSAATTAGTAALWQSIAFTSTYFAAAGTYFLTLISNGTTAKFASFNTAGLPLLTGSTSGGTAGTAANFTAPTTYTANVGPQMLPY